MMTMKTFRKFENRISVVLIFFGEKLDLVLTEKNMELKKVKETQSHCFAILEIFFILVENNKV